MNLIDKIIIFTLCLTLYIPSINNIYMVAPILIVVIYSSLLSYIGNDRFALYSFFIYLVACFYKQAFLFFIPLVCYDIFFYKIKILWALSFLPLISNTSQVLFTTKWLIAAFILVAYIIKKRTESLQKLKESYNKLRDNTKEISIQLKTKNEELLEKQDYEINLATLKERNRIARDIHDNVGHLLSRSILQIGALLAISKDENTKENLNLVKGTLSEAMNSIRASVHDLHEESIDVKYEIQNLVDNFTFCTIKLDYDIKSNLDKNLKYCFIAVTKEALSNIIKHSNATRVSIAIREHPSFYQLILQDNGSNCSYDSENGIGVKNITDRITTIGGNININTDKGFRIFISIPKG